MQKLPFILSRELYFPPVESALTQPNGLLAMGGDLSAKRLLLAYASGIFPWYNEGEPILWWSPNPRMILFLDEFKLRRSLAKRIRNSGMKVKYNQNFAQVLHGCATSHTDGTWLLPEMVSAYLELYAQGHILSVETYLADKLVGGLYGVILGKCFFGESMFSLEKDASKIALAHLVEKLKKANFAFIDTQVNTAHLASLGAREIPRTDFIQLIKANT